VSVGVDAVADLEALAEISNRADEFVIDFPLVPEARRQGSALASQIRVEIEAYDLFTRPLLAGRGAGERVLAVKEGGSGAVWRELGGLGFLGLMVPPEWDGAGSDHPIWLPASGHIEPYGILQSIMASKAHIMPKAQIRGGKLTITIPEEIRDEIDLHDGDEVEVSAEGSRIVLTLKGELAERHPAIDAALAEGLADLRAGRLSPKFATMQEFRAWLKTPEGKKFSTT
jgi:AbrB family looped-hinge helix DNA binding protein